MSNNIFNVYEVPGSVVMYQVEGTPPELIAMLASALDNEQVFTLVFGALIMHAHRNDIDIADAATLALQSLKEST